MTEADTSILILKQQAFDILRNLVAQGDLAENSVTNWTQLILQATSEFDLNNMIATLNAVASSRTEPRFIDVQSHDKTTDLRGRFGVNPERFKFRL